MFTADGDDDVDDAAAAKHRQVCACRVLRDYDIRHENNSRALTKKLVFRAGHDEDVAAAAAAIQRTVVGIWQPQRKTRSEKDAPPHNYALTRRHHRSARVVYTYIIIYNIKIAKRTIFCTFYCASTVTPLAGPLPIGGNSRCAKSDKQRTPPTGCVAVSRFRNVEGGKKKN